jgi:hypothetical protein
MTQADEQPNRSGTDPGQADNTAGQAPSGAPQDDEQQENLQNPQQDGEGASVNEPDESEANSQESAG